MHRSGRDALEPLLDTRARDDVVAATKAHAGADGAVLVPEGVELSVEATDLFTHREVVLGRQLVPQLGTLLAQAFDFLVDLAEGFHAS